MTNQRSRGTGLLDRQPWLVPAAILLVALVLVAIVMLSQRAPTDEQHQGSETAAPDQEAPAEVVEPEQPDLSDVAARDPEDLLATGPVNAPVTLVVFSDYQCPYCAQWNEDTLPEMMANVEAGDLRIEWRDVNVFGPESERAARASYAAALQDRYWEYHNALFPDGETRTTSELGRDGLIDLADQLGLDIDRFAADLDSPRVRDQVHAHEAQGLDLGVHSTPAFILGGEAILGAQPTEVFTDAMDRALAETAE